jgi:Xaa-Pro aminopeptidase
MQLDTMQRALAAAGLDGWLFYDFRGSDPLAASVLGLKSDQILSRRWFYYLPAAGEPTKIVHAIETGALDQLPGRRTIYLPWQQLHSCLKDALAGAHRIAMQYSPANAIPYVSRVDAGTLELVRNLGHEVVSSADLIQQFEATLTPEQFTTHEMAAAGLHDALYHAFAAIADRTAAGRAVSEYEIQQLLMERFDALELVTDHPPIVAIGPHSADPHYAPSAQGSQPINAQDLVLIDLWAKTKAAGAIYADYTWVGYVGLKVPDEYARVFAIVANARDRAVQQIRQALAAGTPIRGCDADDACRKVIADAGFAERFIHRTGHSIHERTHGNGANLDNLETRDERRLIPRTLFSVEPGIYLPGRFGIRSEINVFLPDESTAVVTGPPPQRQIVPLVPGLAKFPAPPGIRN